MSVSNSSESLPLSQSIGASLNDVQISPKAGRLYEFLAQKSIGKGIASKIATKAYKILAGQRNYNQMIENASDAFSTKMSASWQNPKNQTLDADNFYHQGMAVLPQDFQTETAVKSKVAHKIINLAFIKFLDSQKTSKTSVPARDLQSQDESVWVPYTVRASTLTMGEVYPTAALSKAEKQQASLPNIYVHEEKNDTYTISCGVIDTKKKADEFIAVIKNLEDHGKPPRIVMHQLNSFGVKGVGEGEFIRQQHLMSAYIDTQLKTHYEGKFSTPINRPIVSHTNRALNGFTRIAGFSRENKKAAWNNISGWATQMLWLQEDGKLKSLTHSNQLQNNLNELIKIENQQAAHKSSSNEKQISQLRKALNKEMRANVAELQKRQDLSPEEIVFTHLLSQELNMTNKTYPPLTAAQQVAMQFLLDRTLNCHTEINCKSGLDRTGFARALQMAISIQFPSDDKGVTDIDAAYKFFLNFHQNAAQLDALASTKISEGDFDYEDWFNDLQPEQRGIIKFQSLIWAELNSVGVPITERSTGLPGLKWHHDKKSLNPFEKNPHPLDFMPRFVGVPEEEGALKWEELVILKNQGRATLTPLGNQVLMGFSATRGS